MSRCFWKRLRMAGFLMPFSIMIAGADLDLHQIELFADQELLDLWSSIEDINEPTLTDYEKIHAYLRYGKREYLDIMINKGLSNGWPDEVIEYKDDRSRIFYRRLLQRIQLVGENGERPELKIIPIGGCSIEDKSRCIIFYGSFNQDFRLKEEYGFLPNRIIKELEELGFNGHVLFRIGGYPLMEKGGFRFAHIPYSFKVLSFLEAKSLGYQHVLWLDTSIHPNNDLKKIFSCIEKEGCFFLKNGINLDYDYNYGLLPDQTMRSWGIEKEELFHIPHIISGILGVDFGSEKGSQFIKTWLDLTAQVTCSMSFYPEEFLVSVSCWKLGIPPTGHVGNYMEVKSQTQYNPSKANKSFWHSKS